MVLFSDLSVGIADPLMARAFALAERGRGTTSPNPLVGCVVARAGAIVGEGFHERAGGPHAEVVALDAAGDRARGADVYVTLEPCNHTGRTPPCVRRLVDVGVRSVTIGMKDPNTEVRGGGADALRTAGVRVSWVEDPAPFEQQNEAWLKRLRTGMPFVTVKIALTLDGKVSLSPGVRSRISGEGGRAITMHLRDRSSAVAVGARTLATDDPALSVRDCDDTATPRQPVAVVLSRTSLPEPSAQIFVDSPARALVVVGDAAPQDGAELTAVGVRVVRYRSEGGVVAMLGALASEGLDDVLIETGPGLLGALWQAGTIDELVVVTAGGMGGPSAPGVSVLEADADGVDLAPRMRAVESAIIGDDAVTVWRPLER